MPEKRSSYQWFNPYISLLVPWLVTLNQGRDKKRYRSIIRGLLPETLNQRKSDTDAVNSLLVRWNHGTSKSDLEIISKLLSRGIRLVEKGWLIGLGSGVVLIFVGFAAINISNYLATISTQTSLTPPGNPPSPPPDNSGILVLPGVNVSDMDSANFDTGTLTVKFTPSATPDDRLSIRDRGKNPGEIGVDGNNITYGGIAIGSFQGGEGTVPLTVTFNDKSRPEHAQALMRSIVYQNISNNPVIGSRTVQFQLNDGGENGTSKAIAQIINVTTENQAPVLTVPNNKTVKENANLIITDISISDSDGQNIIVTMSVTNGILTVKTDVDQGLTTNNISGNQTKTITLKGTVSQINATLANAAGITYRGNPDFSGNDELTIAANDGGKTSTVIPKKSLVWPPDALSSKTDKKSLNLTVTPMNVPPIVTVPDRTIAKENTNLIISGISISDPDTQNLTVTMSVTNGILTVKGDVVQGLIAQNITGNKTKTVTFKGTIAQINTTLAKAAGVIYLGNKDFSGKDSLNITVSDNGKKPESKTINIIVNPMNRPPQLTIAEVVTVGQNTITQKEAVTLIKSWLQAKGEAYIPPFNPEVIARYTTGEYYKKSIGSVDWLKNNNAYYKYESPTVEPTGKFSLEGERVTIEMIVKENPTLFVNERVDPTSSGPSTGMYRFILQFDSGTWKIADTQKID
ncbi:IMS domain-containing protein [Microcoleus sp. OTE_8_concoct_300]|uniref:IMS domain-containing protein n=1 Tax=Microcoleus sp. OTE_8_concoct_300 TaxID=2964710 RepID=UPI00403F6343